MRTRINVTFTAGTRAIITGISDLTIPDIRLIVNETQKVVVASSMQKDNILSISNGVINYATTIPVLAANDQLTVEIDKANALPTDYAKQGNDGTISLTSINSKMDSSYATNSQAIEAIEDYLTPYTPINS